MIVHLYHVFLINKKKKAPSRTGGPHLVSSAQWNPLLTFISLPFTRRWLFFFSRQKKKSGEEASLQRGRAAALVYSDRRVCVCPCRPSKPEHQRSAGGSGRGGERHPVHHRLRALLRGGWRRAELQDHRSKGKKKKQSRDPLITSQIGTHWSRAELEFKLQSWANVYKCVVFKMSKEKRATALMCLCVFIW